MNFRTVARPFLPHFLKCLYYQHLLAGLMPESDALTCVPFIHSGDMVIDIGANIGKYTKFLSEIVGPQGSVHSYEPIPETFSYLRHNVRKLRLSNVSLHQAAVSSYRGNLRMKVPKGNFYQAEISADGDQAVQIVRLDDEFRDSRAISFIKCDAEGHEKEVIEGALNLIRRDRPVWLMETRSQPVIERIRELGYRADQLEHDWLFRA